MLKIKCFTVNSFGENCYIISDESEEAVIIDDGAVGVEHTAIDRYIKENHLVPKLMLCTHAHFDHTMGCFDIYRRYQLKPQMNQKDFGLYTDLHAQVESFLGQVKISIETAPLGEALYEGQKIHFGNHNIDVIETPGHTLGGVCLFCSSENILFSGDTIFRHSIGRTDFPGGDYNTLITAIKSKLFSLPDNTIVYPGHGEETTIYEEKHYNPFLI